MSVVETDSQTAVSAVMVDSMDIVESPVEAAGNHDDRSVSRTSSRSSSASLAASGATFPENGELTVESEGSFTWCVETFSTLGTDKIYSPHFKVGQHSWRVLLYPRGNEPHAGQALSMFVALDLPTAGPDKDAAVCAQMILSVQHQTRPELSVAKYTQHRFDSSEPDWGFSAFTSLKSLVQGEEPLISADDCLTVHVRLRIIRDETGILWHNFINYNSKRVTGHVGLANQGATCYMNSLLQSLYSTNSFRRLIYGIPTEKDVPSESSALALQRIFWRLQFGDLPVSTAELTTAFGWDTMEAFIQSDVQEFSRILMDELERRAKGTAVEGDLERLFVGKVRNVIRCTNVSFQSTRTESFYDLQLTIKGMRTLKESFDNYVKAETLEGDNKYRAEGHGLQDAQRFVEFEAFPPVLHLHLERYAFDPRVMGTVKINDRLEFPRRIALDCYLAPDSPQQGQPQDFLLHAVFVHSGDSHGGHYYVYICDDPRKENPRWLRFDDTKVIPATAREAMDDTFGGEETVDEPQSEAAVITRSALRSREKHRKYFTNAYMLVYIREADADRILAETREAEIPPHIGRNVRTEDETVAARRLEKQQQLMTVRAHILTDANMAEYGGFDLYNLDNRNLPQSEGLLVLRARRDEPLRALRAQVATQLNEPEERIRLWTFSYRRNKTVRLDEPVAVPDLDLPVSTFVARLSHHSHHFVLYAEVLADGPTGAAPPETKLVFFKFYDPEHGVLKPVGKLYIRNSDRPNDLLPALREMIGLPSRSTAPLIFYEEVKPTRVDAISPHKTFEELQIISGDIVCFQLAEPILDPKSATMPKAADYYRAIASCICVEFRDEEGKVITGSHLSADTRYGDILQELAKGLQQPATHIRLHLIDGADELWPLKKIPLTATLSEILKSSSANTLYETAGAAFAVKITPVPVEELDAMKEITLSLMTSLAGGEAAAPVTGKVLVGAHDTVDTLFPKLPESFRSALRLPIRLVETLNNRVIRDYIDEDVLAPLGETSFVYVESADPAELDPPPGHVIISVMSYANKDPVRTHGIPFRFPLRPDEPFRLTRERLVARMGVDPAAAEKWTFGIVSYGRARPIGDDDVLASAGLSAHDQLGICRPDPAARPATPAGERSIKIRSSAKSTSTQP